MSEFKIQLTGWQAIVVAIALIGVVAVRFMTLDDMRNDRDLMKHIDTLLMDEYSPHVAEKLRTAYDTGDKDELGEAVESVTTTDVNVDSVRASYPLFDFSLPKDVVIKVEFSLSDASGQGAKRTIYYLFRSGTFGWQYQYVASNWSYYLNFL